MKVYLVYDTFGADEDYVLAVYENQADAEEDYPWNYVETKYLQTSSRTQTPEEGK